MKSLVIVPPLTYEYLPKCRVEFNAVFSILIEEGTLLQKNLKNRGFNSTTDGLF